MIELKKLQKTPADFLSGKAASRVRKLLGGRYTAAVADFNKRSIPREIPGQFDEEQSWQTVELLNNAAVESALAQITSFHVSSDPLSYGLELAEPEEALEDEEDEDDDESGEEDDGSEVSGEDDEGDVLEDEEEEEETDSAASKENVDFFDSAEMTEFLTETDRRGVDDDLAEFDSDGVDMFDDLEEAVPEDKFKDFFTDPKTKQISSKREAIPNADDIKAAPVKSMPFVDYESDADTPFEAAQAALRRRMRAQESENMKQRSWAEMGEAANTDRPANALLAEHLEYDVASRPAPLITEDYTTKLETLIKQRIKDRAFDDVERKVKLSTSQPASGRQSQPQISAERPEGGLAGVYEKEFLAQTQKQVERKEGEPHPHAELEKSLKSLFEKLDQLTHYHFAPRPAAAELRIVSSAPAVTVEEVAPTITAAGDLLAPEEIHKHIKAAPVANEELTKAGRLRIRKNKRVKQGRHFQLNEGKKNREEDKAASREKQKTEKRRSKNDFFSEMQAKVHSELAGKTVKRKNKTENTDAKRLKL